MILQLTPYFILVEFRRQVHTGRIYPTRLNSVGESAINDDKLINDDLAMLAQAQIPLTIVNPELTYCCWSVAAKIQWQFVTSRLTLLYQPKLFKLRSALSFNGFHFGAAPMTSKTDQATSDSFSAYCQIAAHTLC